MFDDDFPIGILLPWPIAMLLLAVFLIGWAIYASLPIEKKAEICTSRAEKYHIESRYDSDLGCVVKVGDGRWQEISKYEKSGIINMK